MTFKHLLAAATASIAFVATPTVAAETLIVPFTTPDAATTVGKYSGIVYLRVSGIGQSNQTTYNDAFYLYNDTIAFNMSQFYQLAFSTSPLLANNPATEAKYALVGPMPAYNPAHVYTFAIDTGLVSPGFLHFGVSDNGYGDNSGQYVIAVGVPEPASWAMMIAGFGLVGAAMRRRQVAVTA